MLLTKHCSPVARDNMLLGHFRFGTHEKFSRGENTGPMSDTLEGQANLDVSDPTQRKSWSWGDRVRVTNFSNDSVLPPGRFAFRMGVSENSTLFCTSIGDYNRVRHFRIWKGDASVDYGGDITYSAFLVFDCDRLLYAIRLLANLAYGEGVDVLHGAVDYGERDRRVPPYLLNSRFNQDVFIPNTRRVAFTKPKRFRLEEEYRFSIVPKDPSTVRELQTEGMSNDVTDAFRAAIYSGGNVVPD